MSQRYQSDHFKSEFIAKERSIILGEYIKETGATVRETAKEYGISKSTVHKDVTERLFSVNKGLYEDVKSVLMKNKAERHIRGGNATKEKYREIRTVKEKKVR
ncbi:MAG: sporulation transcriptional regulator SpoIIID [Clostridia bacterium]|nr:sporulation transcriptional regulator SpoIIID [Clostridia bacterium]